MKKLIFVAIVALGLSGCVAAAPLGWVALGGMAGVGGTVLVQHIDHVDHNSK